MEPAILKSVVLLLTPGHSNLFHLPEDVQKILASAGIRDEHVFPVPIILETKPTLTGYYRLLLGVPQKSFYKGSTGMGRFKSMEARGSLNSAQRTALPLFCTAMTASLSDLVRQMSPTITDRDVTELPILTIGSQFQGSNNTKIGKQAVASAFLAVAEVMKDHLVTPVGDRELVVKNSAGRLVRLRLASDPDLGIQEQFGDEWRKKVAIEIKGGTDVSNAHNRAGEAEKSHQKAKKAGYRDFWTLISTKGLDMAKVKAESPTTTLWFEVSEVLGREGPQWEEFKSRLSGEVGIPLS